MNVTREKPEIIKAVDLVHLNISQRLTLLGKKKWFMRREFLKQMLGIAAVFSVPLSALQGCGKDSSTSPGDECSSDNPCDCEQHVACDCESYTPCSCESDQPLPEEMVSITVTEPNGGEKWNLGKKYNIEWESTGIDGTVEIDLYKSGRWYRDVADDVENTGSYLWMIPSNIETSQYYKIRVFVPEVYGESSSNFTIEPEPFIKVTDPTSSSRWGNGNYKYIEWESNNAGSYVKIQLCRKSGNKEVIEKTIDPSANNDGSYHWEVDTDYLGTYIYRIKIISVQYTSIYGYSEYFSVTF